MSDIKEEECLLEREDAEALALDYWRYEGAAPNKNDPKPDIPHSLLSAEHIRDYVLQTGLIAPFFIKGGRESRLKDAAYEGRIGEVAYQYMPGENFPKIVFTPEDSYLTVPKNSIIFVECDLDFRLPEFIALRFNLQIKHVHRGLLLGTGPLVDPGYWGKLCIPLHNLTDEDYIVDKDDGLIWLEFTKTTTNSALGKERIGRPPLGNPFWEIGDFLNKATQPINYAHPRVGIHSAIPAAYEASVEAAQKAERSAKKSRSYTFVGVSAGVVAAIAVIISLFTLTYNYYSDMDVQFKEVRPSIIRIKEDLKRVEENLTKLIATQIPSSDDSETMTEEQLRIPEPEIAE